MLYLHWAKSKWERFKGSLDKTYDDDNIKGPFKETLKFSKYVTREARVQSSKALLHDEALAEKGLSVGQSSLIIKSENLEYTKNVEKMTLNREGINKVNNLRVSEIRSMLKNLSRILITGEWGQKILMANTEKTTYT